MFENVHYKIAMILHTIAIPLGHREECLQRDSFSRAGLSREGLLDFPLSATALASKVENKHLSTEAISLIALAAQSSKCSIIFTGDRHSLNA